MLKMETKLHSGKSKFCVMPVHCIGSYNKIEVQKCFPAWKEPLTSNIIVYTLLP